MINSIYKHRIGVELVNLCAVYLGLAAIGFDVASLLALGGWV